MVDFTGRKCGIALLPEVLGHRDDVGESLNRAEPGSKAVDAGRRRSKAGEKTCAGGVAEGRLAVCVGEEHAPIGKAVDVRRLRLRVAAQAADPVVQVVNGDEEDVRPVGLRG